MKELIQIVASNPPAILVTLGGVGYLSGVSGAGFILFLGCALQVGWLAR